MRSLRPATCRPSKRTSSTAAGAVFRLTGCRASGARRRAKRRRSSSARSRTSVPPRARMTMRYSSTWPPRSRRSSLRRTSGPRRRGSCRSRRVTEQAAGAARSASRDVPVHRPELAHARPQGRVDAALQQSLFSGCSRRRRARGAPFPRSRSATGAGRRHAGRWRDPRPRAGSAGADHRSTTCRRRPRRPHPAGQSCQAAVRTARPRPADPPREDQDPESGKADRLFTGTTSWPPARPGARHPEAGQVPDDERARCRGRCAGLVPHVEVHMAPRSCGSGTPPGACAAR